MNSKKHRGWIASLSNGQTVLESEQQSNSESSWESLITWCRQSKTNITQMRLQYNGVTAVAIKGADGYVQLKQRRIRDPDKPSALYHGIGSVINNIVFMLWMNTNGDSWQEIRSLDSVRVHCLINVKENGD